MSIFDENKTERVVEVEEAILESEPTWFDKTKDMVLSGLKSIKEYMEDNPDTVVLWIYAGFTGGMGISFLKYMHTLNKTAKLDYYNKVLDLYCGRK